MSYTYTDREGFVWDKHCMTCDRYHMRGKPTGDPAKRTNKMTYCSGHEVYFNEEPFKSYEKAGSKNNDCPLFAKAC